MEVFTMSYDDDDEEDDDEEYEEDDESDEDDDDEEYDEDDESDEDDDDEEYDEDDESDEDDDDEEYDEDDESDEDDDDEEYDEDDESDEDDDDEEYDEDDESDEDDDEYEYDEADIEINEDEEIFTSMDDYPNANEEDFKDDKGDWTVKDYQETAKNIFGEHEFFGQTANDQYLDSGYGLSNKNDTYLEKLSGKVKGISQVVNFYEKEGTVYALGFVPAYVLSIIQNQYPDIDLSKLQVSVPRKNNDEQPSHKPSKLPDVIANIDPKEGVDLRKYCSPVGDQGQTYRCAAFAWTHTLELCAKLLGKNFPPLASSYTMLQFQKDQGDYKNFKFAYSGGDGTAGTIEPGNVIMKNGTCREELWPNDAKTPINNKESILMDDAKKYSLPNVVLKDISVDDMKKVLSAGYPVQISMATGEAFSEVGRDGIFSAAEAPSGEHGYHSMLCVGYIGNYFIIKNSWGTDWGDKGYCYIPKEVLKKSEPSPVSVIPISKA